MPLIQRLQSKLNPNLVRLLAYLKPHKGKLLMSVFFMIGAGAGSSLIALLLGKLTDVGFYDQVEWIVLATPARWSRSCACFSGTTGCSPS